MLRTKVVEKIRIYILCSTTFSIKSCHLWDNLEKYGRTRQATDDNAIRLVRFACWITKATNTLRIFKTCCSFRTTVVTRTPFDITCLFFVRISEQAGVTFLSRFNWFCFHNPDPVRFLCGTSIIFGIIQVNFNLRKANKETTEWNRVLKKTCLGSPVSLCSIFPLWVGTEGHEGGRTSDWRIRSARCGSV